MVEDYQKVLKTTGLTLQPHQISGVQQILSWRDSRHGGIVADEMGLGKTCQAVAALSILETANNSVKSLIVSPLSVISHWEMELEKFGVGRLRCKKYMGNANARKEIRKELQNSNWNVLLTTYQFIIVDSEYFLSKWKFTALFFDEAQRLKSSTSVLHEIIRQMEIDWVVLLTGTPVQNNLQELYSLLVLVDKKRFLLTSAAKFLEKYKNLESNEVAENLRGMLKAYLLRRTKEEIAIQIPASSEVVIYHGMSDLQKDLYRAILLKNYSFFEQFEVRSSDYSSSSKTSLLNIMMQLRKCVLHPYLFEGVEPEPFEEGEHLVEASGKFALLDCLLKYLKAKNHRVLIFSQMTRALDVVQDYLTYRGISYERLDGSVRAEERFAALSNFQNSEQETLCFLLSTKAGGVGLNLTSADTVIFLDSDFNPQNDVQAAARCHRIGQTKPVKVIRLIAKHTVEEIINYRASRKLRLTRQVLGSKELEKENMTAAEISEMILYGLGQLNERISGKPQKEMSFDEIEVIVGQSKDGVWVNSGEDNDKKESSEEKMEENEVLQSQNDVESKMENMYIFEGHDYKKDREVLKTILAEGQKRSADDVSKASKVSTKSVPQVRKPLTKEQIEERAKKRAETLKKKKKLETEERKEREKLKEEKKSLMWKKNNYTSINLPFMDSETEGDSAALSSEESGEQYGPFFIVGNVAEPKFDKSDSSTHAVILHTVDNSGKFGRGGVFDALLSKSSRIRDAYELAGRMNDLQLGDALFIEGVTGSDSVFSKTAAGQKFVTGDTNEVAGPSNFENRRQRKESVVLLVVQHARRRDQISQEALSKSLSRLATYAMKNKEISVHLPRIGYGMRNIQWYIIERLIRKYLTANHIRTYVYYYKKGGSTEAAERYRKRRRTSEASYGASEISVNSSKTSSNLLKQSASRRKHRKEDEKPDLNDEEEDEEEIEFEDNETSSEDEADDDFLNNESSSDEGCSKIKRRLKKIRKQPGSLFKNMKISVELLEVIDRSRYADIIEAQDGIAVTDSNEIFDVRYVLVDSSTSKEKLGNINKNLSHNCAFVRKEWIDDCCDDGCLKDTANFVP